MYVRVCRVMLNKWANIYKTEALKGSMNMWLYGESLLPLEIQTQVDELYYTSEDRTNI